MSPNGLITTVAGTGQDGSEGDGGPATSATVNGPTGVAIDGQGNLFIAEGYGNRIRKVSPDGIISTVAGTGVSGYNGDGRLATSAELDYPTAIAVDRQGNLFIAETYGNRVRKVSPDGIITTVAGTGMWGYNGDGGPAAAAQLSYPTAVAVDAEENLYIADAFNSRIRKIAPPLPGVFSTKYLSSPLPMAVRSMSSIIRVGTCAR